MESIKLTFASEEVARQWNCDRKELNAKSVLREEQTKVVNKKREDAHDAIMNLIFSSLSL